MSAHLLDAAPPSRAERRRFDRELHAVRPNAGVGQGWRLTRGRFPRRYRVREHRQPVDVDRLERESDEARARIRTGVVES